MDLSELPPIGEGFWYLVRSRLPPPTPLHYTRPPSGQGWTLPRLGQPHQTVLLMGIRVAVDLLASQVDRAARVAAEAARSVRRAGDSSQFFDIFSTPGQRFLGYLLDVEQGGRPSAVEANGLRRPVTRGIR